MHKNSRGIAVILPILLVLIILGTVGYIVYNNYQSNLESTSSRNVLVPTFAPLPSPADSPTSYKDSYTENTSITNQKTYTSPNLGISFLYLSPYGGEELAVKEIGSKVYLYPSQYEYEGGQYVEVFQKDSDDTIIETIKSTFLKGYPTDDCIAAETTYLDNYPPNYVQVVIKVPGEFTDIEEISLKWGKCPNPYTTTNGIAYFLMDKNHPDKYVFFSIGQDAIMANLEEKLTWQDTITFFE